MGWISTLFFGNAGLPTTASAVGRPKVNLSCEKGVIGMKSKGFTLIELLIVVAIIAILALIAVPNFLEAQMRAKISRVKNDQRSIAMALEAYSIDNLNQYPNMHTLNGNTWEYVGWGYAQRKLTTPIAYITSML